MNTHIRDVDLYVKVIGQGAPLLLMHGGPGLDHTSLLPLQPLADQFTLIFYDQRCNGRSNGAQVSTMTFDNLTADADTLRQSLGFDRWALLGHSFGGNVALEYALRYPQHLSHLILMDSGADTCWVQHNAAQVLAKRGYSPAAVQAVRRFYSGKLTPAEFLPTVMKFNRAYFHHFSPLWMLWQMAFGPAVKMRPETFIFGYSQLLNGWTVMDHLSQIQTPTLVLAGRSDFLYPPEHQAILAEHLPHAQLELIERAGHIPQMEQPEQVIRTIRKFLASGNPCWSQ